MKQRGAGQKHSDGQNASQSHDDAYKKHAMKGKKEHPIVSVLVFVVGTLVGVVPLVIFAKKLMAPIPSP